jgi:hypothetical protein
MRLCSSVADPHSFFAVPDPGNHELGQLRRAKYQYKGVLSYYSYFKKFPQAPREYLRFF